MIRKIRLSDSFTCGKMLRFALPSVVMNVFTSLYSVVDGFFVANYAGIKRVPSRPAKKRISWYSTKTCLRHRKKAFPTTSLQRCILPGRK